LPAIAFADADDDEYWNENDYVDNQCQDLCDLVINCGIPCLNNVNCVVYCKDSLSSDKRDCRYFDKCDDIKECLCSSDGDDDDDGCGCDVSHSETGSALTFLMLAVGLLALWIGAHKTKEKN